MKFKFDKKYLHWGITAFLVIVASILFYYLLFHRDSLSAAIKMFAKIAMPIIDGFIVAYLLTPVLNKIEGRIIKPLYEKAKLPMTPKTKRRIRGFSILVTNIVVLVILYEFLNLVIPEVVHSIQSIIVQFPIYINNLTNWALDLLKNNPEMEETVDALIKQYSPKIMNFIDTNLLPYINTMIKTLSLSVLGVFKAFWNFIIGFIISIYLLGSKETFAGQAKKIAYALFERKTGNELISTFRFIHSTFVGFVGGKIVDSIIIGLICFACTNIIGTPYATLVSVIIGVTNIIPFFGPWIGGIPSALLVLMVNPIQALYFAILIFVLQQFDGNILGPKILGESTGLSGFWVIFSITIFGGLFGVIGMVIGVPTFAVFYAGVKTFVNRKLEKKNLPVESKPYMTVGQIGETNEFIEYVTEVKKNRNQKKMKKKESGGED